ncbi:flavodoxin-dependent (E)-4-hydroxy-3-methylbut-2-enyl-diphosphate synthase [bacterium]|nr:MAG: flavodoxin-dependent (E)-4-hydroxy-3-methylbut-2-enyl-diphosphate synthase [bacterium]
MRRKTRVVKIGNIFIGGNNPIAIQSMAKVKTEYAEKAIRQIRLLEDAGCEIVRVAVKDIKDAKAIKKIKPKIHIPMVADIHFDWRLALESIENGVDKIRLNPGNIFKKEQVKEVVRAAKSAKIPIRVGLNSGSIGNDPDPVGAMVKAAGSYLKILEGMSFYNTVISLKGSDILDTVEAYRKMSKICDYPFHLGVTATGFPLHGAVKTSIAIGVLLLEGIGDTIRVSLTDEPEQEIKTARYILESLGLRNFGPQIISCPTCGRCEVDLVRIVKDLENKLSDVGISLPAKASKIAVMGCVVNGPGEARHADLGVAFGKKEGLLFKKGKAIRKVSANKCADLLLEELRKGL